jgi:UDP-N-acetylmuramate: L-alanyl-gamma-D-glutamyl-meso-diaminopimelate ligase
VPVQQAATALARFRGVRRRQEVRGEVRGITVLDDFAHHPTAMHTTINGLRRQVDARWNPTQPRPRVLAVFEPRSNTMKLGTMKAQLPWALEEADLSFCHSGGLDWDATQVLAPLGSVASVSTSVDQLVARVVAAAQPGDHVLCMSNGGFGNVHARLLEALSARST